MFGLFALECKRTETGRPYIKLEVEQIKWYQFGGSWNSEFACVYVLSKIIPLFYGYFQVYLVPSSYDSNCCQHTGRPVLPQSCYL